MGLGLVGLSQTRNLPMFYIFFIVASVGTAGTSHGVTWAVIISRWFVRRRGRAMGIATLGPTFGTLFVVINTILVTQFGWRWVLFGYGIVVGGGGSALGMFARPYPEEYGYLPDGADPRSQGALEGATHAIGQGPRPRTQGLSPGEVLRTPDFWVITLFLTSAFVGTSALQAHQLAYFASKGFSTSSAAITVLVAGLASGIGRIGAGTLVDLVDYRLVLAMVTVLLGVSFLYLAIVPVGGLATALPFALLFGVGWGSSVPVRPIVGGFTFGNKSLGAVVGFMHFGSLAGGVVGPLLMGYIFDTQGTYDSAIWILAVITLSTLPVLLYLKPRSKLPLSRTPRRTADDALPAANENSD
jgi:MFS family permease